jgi:hypothetical protein
MDFTRQFSEQDIQVLNDVQAALIVRGIRMKTGEPHADENANMIVDWFDKNQGVPITYDQVLAVANLLVSKLHYVSPLAAEFNTLLIKLDPEEATTLQEFLRRYSLVQIDGSNAGFKNATLLLNWLKRGDGRNPFAVTISNLAAGMEGFNRSTDPKNQLVWTEKPQTEKKTYGRHSADDVPDRQPGELFSDKDTSREFINGRRNHAFSGEEQKPVASALDSSEEAWERMGLAVINSGRTHGQKTERQEKFDAELAKTGSYRLACKAVQAVAKEHEMRGY